MNLRFNAKYFQCSFLLLAVEIFIAVYVHDTIIRPYIGDFLVVILLYCMVKSVLNTDNILIALSVLSFSFLLETLQYFNLVKLLHLESYPLANVIIGTSFAWVDILAYSLGILTVLIVERELFK